MLSLNQKLRLSLSLMQQGDWDTALALIKNLEYCIGAYPPAALALIGRIEYLLSDLYRPYVD